MSDFDTMEMPVLGSTYKHLLDFLKEPDAPTPLLSPRRFSQVMHIDLQTLAEQAHVHRNTISRSPGSRGVQDFLREALRVIKAALSMSIQIGRT